MARQFKRIKQVKVLNWYSIKYDIKQQMNCYGSAQFHYSSNKQKLKAECETQQNSWGRANCIFPLDNYVTVSTIIRLTSIL